MSATGAVYDRGYRPYEGPRGQRGAATAALYRATVRRALGWRRSWRQKFAPLVLLGVVTIPAIVQIAVGYLTRNETNPANRIEIVSYRDYVGVSSALLLFVALVAPDVICPDRRNHVLPLMFSRPLTGRDYVAAKVGALFSILFAFSVIPQLILFIGNMLVSNGAASYFTGHLDILWKVPLSAAVLALFHTLIGLSVSSLTDRRIVAGASLIGLFLLTSIAASVLVGEHIGRRGGKPAGLLNIVQLPLYLRDLIFNGRIGSDMHLYRVDNGGVLAVAVYSAVVVVAAAVLLRRYRWVER